LQIEKWQIEHLVRRACCAVRAQVPQPPRCREIARLARDGAQAPITTINLYAEQRIIGWGYWTSIWFVWIGSTPILSLFEK
jgi:hypothetical protein